MLFIIGLIVGALQTGCMTARTIEVMRGHLLNTVITSIVISAAFYVTARLALSSDLTGYIGVSLGGAAVTALMASLNHHRTAADAGGAEKREMT